MAIILQENMLRAEDFLKLRESAGWGSVPVDQVAESLKKSLFTVVANDDARAIAMGRLVGDGVMYFYLHDVIVLPEYQHQGLGGMIVQRLLDYILSVGLAGTTVNVGLTAARDKEGFYRKFGFIERPEGPFGAGMAMRLSIPPKNFN